jgi:uroporphyrinogen-III synthase
MFTLSGRKIALLERRQGDEFATLVHRLGGEPISAPAMDAVPCHNDFRSFLEGLTARRFSLAIFLTGEGTLTLLDETERRGRLADARAALRQLTIACRGAKPLEALARYGLRAQITTARPHTTDALMGALQTVDVTDRGVLLVHYGERHVELASDLRRRGARLVEICPYEWTLPEDVAPMARLVRDAIARRLDAVLFTSQVQCRHLFLVAAEMGQAEGLALSLNRDIVVGAVGPFCAGSLVKAGVTPDVVASSPNMPSLVNAVAQYFGRPETAGPPR